MTKQFRQGDVFLEEVPALPTEATQGKVQPDGSIVLAWGEVTGHKHQFVASYGVSLWDQDGQRYIQVPEGGAVLSHEEHNAIAVPAGCYRIIAQREYAPDEIRRVID